VKIYGVDATTGSTSGTVYEDHTQTPQDVGKWLTIGVNQATLAPNTSQTIPFVVSIPRVVRSGEHVGGIVAEVVSSIHLPGSTPQSTQGLQLLTRHLAIIAVEMILPGPHIEQVKIDTIHVARNHHELALLLKLSNIGTMMVKPIGVLQLRTTQGTLIQETHLKLDTILPLTTIEYPVFLQQELLKVGAYQAALTLHYGQNYTVTFHAPITISQDNIQQAQSHASSPQILSATFVGSLSFWLLLLGAIALLGLVFVGGYILAYKKR
jgi:hypothetical protein